MYYEFFYGIGSPGINVELIYEATAHEGEVAFKRCRVEINVHDAVIGNVAASGVAVYCWSDNLAPHHARFLASLVSLQARPHKYLMYDVANLLRFSLFHGGVG